MSIYGNNHSLIRVCDASTRSACFITRYQFTLVLRSHRTLTALHTGIMPMTARHHPHHRTPGLKLFVIPKGGIVGELHGESSFHGQAPGSSQGIRQFLANVPEHMQQVHCKQPSCRTRGLLPTHAQRKAAVVTDLLFLDRPLTVSWR